MNAAVMGSPFDYPLSSRFDENDAVLVFERALIPWEGILVYKDIQKANFFFIANHWANLFTFHGTTRLAVKFDFITGLLHKAVKTSGVDQFRGVQANIGEVVAWRNLFWGISDAMALNPQPGHNGAVVPNLDYGMTYRIMMSKAWLRMKEIIEDLVAGNLIVQPSSAKDFKNPELRPTLDKLYRGSNGITSVEKIKLIKLLWEVIGTEYGGRHELYELNYSGSSDRVRTEALDYSRMKGDISKFEVFVEECMDDYDLDGWKNDTWINPDDVHYFKK